MMYFKESVRRSMALMEIQNAISHKVEALQTTNKVKLSSLFS